jgi:hypothetical protein
MCEHSCQQVKCIIRCRKKIRENTPKAACGRGGRADPEKYILFIMALIHVHEFFSRGGGGGGGKIGKPHF